MPDPRNPWLAARAEGLGVRWLGEGGGAARAIGLVEAGCRTLSEMRSFEEAGIVDAVDREGRR